jgi:hypothetical protein
MRSARTFTGPSLRLGRSLITYTRCYYAKLLNRQATIELGGQLSHKIHLEYGANVCNNPFRRVATERGLASAAHRGSVVRLGVDEMLESRSIVFITAGALIVIGLLDLAFQPKIWTNKIAREATLSCLQTYPSQSQVAACITLEREKYKP